MNDSQAAHESGLPSAQAGGFVSLVGGGPGDLGLVTLRALDRVRRADVIFCDYLATPLLLQFARPDAEVFHVGKRAGARCIPQEAIESLLVLEAQAGKRVVRLKGGDPFLFGRGGEEVQRLQEEGIAYEIVPGVTSAVAVPAAAGIPVTDRRVASSLLVVTGHEDPTRAENRVVWERAAQAADTLVVLMATRQLELVVSQLLQFGRAASTPAAAISWGTTAAQRRVTATLGTLVQAVQQAGIRSPAVVVVGAVVALAPRISPFEMLPLFGCRVALTREHAASLELAQALVELGAEPIVAPAIAFECLAQEPQVQAQIADLADYRWVVFTSANGVRYFGEALKAGGRDSRALAGARIAAIGQATAAALVSLGLIADVVARDSRGEGMAEAVLALGPLHGDKVLIARAEEAREVLTAALVQAGAEVHVASVYRTVDGDSEPLEELGMRLGHGEVDAVLFASAGTLQRTMQALGGAEAAVPLLSRAACFAIGPISAAALVRAGLEVAGQAEEASAQALVRALVQWWQREGIERRRGATWVWDEGAAQQ